MNYIFLTFGGREMLEIQDEMEKPLYDPVTPKVVSTSRRVIRGNDSGTVVAFTLLSCLMRMW